MSLPSLEKIAAALGGDVSNGQVLCPGPEHSAADRSLSVKLDPTAPDGFVVHSFSGDDDIVCKDYVRGKLGLPPFEPKPKKNGKANGGGKPYSSTIATFIYRDEHGQPYLRVDRTAAKDFFQHHWTGESWKAGAPKGPKIPYLLPQLKAAPMTTPVYVVEGEGKADMLTKLGFVATSASGGAGKWTADLNKWFEARAIYIVPDNDAPGRKHAAQVARNLNPVAASVHIVELPGLLPKGDIKQWLGHDPSGARLIKECERAPLWEPSVADDKVDDAADYNDETEDGIALAFAEQEQNNLRHIAENGRWLIWSATHWRVDNILAAYRTARILCRKRGARKQKTVAAVVTLAKSDIRLVATMEQFDARAPRKIAASFDLCESDA
jgi:hypothetical protein